MLSPTFPEKFDPITKFRSFSLSRAAAMPITTRSLDVLADAS